MFYERLTKHMSKTLTYKASTIIQIDKKHRLNSIKFNQMKKIILLFTSLFFFSYLEANDNLKLYVEKALKNNLQLNAERKNFESSKQSKNISRSEFLPSITLSGEQTSTTSTNRTNQNGASLSDSNSDSDSKKISVEQKIFSGFKGLNTFKKSELETQKANLLLKKVEPKCTTNI